MTEKLEGLMAANNALLATISRQLDRMAQQSAPLSPGYRRDLSEFARFDWSSIGAQVVREDGQGAATVEWNQQRFIRRSGSGKFGKAIWFSRPLGKDDDATTYARLITFKDSEAEPLAVEVPAPASKAQLCQTPSVNNSCSSTTGSLRNLKHPGSDVFPENNTPEEIRLTTDNSPTAYWTIAAQLIEAGRVTHDRASQVAREEGTWAEKASRLLL